jgi:plasmid stabilization system protein ParE
VARIVLAPEATEDLGRLSAFPLEKDPAAALETYDLIAGAIDVLASHDRAASRAWLPRARDLPRQLGYLALYDYVIVDDVVIVLALRHQREAGYVDPWGAD